MAGRFTNGLGERKVQLSLHSPTPSHFSPIPSHLPFGVSLGKIEKVQKPFGGWEKRRSLPTNCSWTIFLKAFPITESCTRSVWRLRQYIFTVTDEVNRYNELKYLRILFFTFPSWTGPLLIMTSVVSWVWADQIPRFLQETRGLGRCIWSLENSLFNSSRVDLLV